MAFAGGVALREGWGLSVSLLPPPSQVHLSTSLKYLTCDPQHLINAGRELAVLPNVLHPFVSGMICTKPSIRHISKHVPNYLIVFSPLPWISKPSNPFTFKPQPWRKM